jgi:hypothetical protein
VVVVAVATEVVAVVVVAAAAAAGWGRDLVNERAEANALALRAHLLLLRRRLAAPRVFSHPLRALRAVRAVRRRVCLLRRRASFVPRRRLSAARRRVGRRRRSRPGPPRRPLAARRARDCRPWAERDWRVGVHAECRAEHGRGAQRGAWACCLRRKHGGELPARARVAPPGLQRGAVAVSGNTRNVHERKEGRDVSG